MKVELLGEGGSVPCAADGLSGHVLWSRDDPATSPAADLGAPKGGVSRSLLAKKPVTTGL